MSHRGPSSGKQAKGKAGREDNRGRAGCPGNRASGGGSNKDAAWPPATTHARNGAWVFCTWRRLGSGRNPKPTRPSQIWKTRAALGVKGIADGHASPSAPPFRGVGLGSSCGAPDGLKTWWRCRHQHHKPGQRSGKTTAYSSKLPRRSGPAPSGRGGKAWSSTDGP